MCRYRQAADKKIMLINTSFVCYSDHVDSILLLGLHSIYTRYCGFSPLCYSRWFTTYSMKLGYIFHCLLQEVLIYIE